MDPLVSGTIRSETRPGRRLCPTNGSSESSSPLMGSLEMQLISLPLVGLDRSSSSASRVLDKAPRNVIPVSTVEERWIQIGEEVLKPGCELFFESCFEKKKKTTF